MQHASSFGLLDADHGEDDDDDAVVVCVGHTALPNPAGAFISHQASLSSTFNSIVDTDTGSERENRSSNVNVMLYRYQQYQYQCRSIRHSKIIGIHSIVTVSESPPQR